MIKKSTGILAIALALSILAACNQTDVESSLTTSSADTTSEIVSETSSDFSENDDILTIVLKKEGDIDYEFLCTGRLQTTD